MKDKEISDSLKMLSENGTEFIYTTVKDNPRAATACELSEKAASLGYPGIHFEQIEEAYKCAISKNKLVVVCGSLYLYKDKGVQLFQEAVL